ncbi:MAG: hypothetical protein VX913_13245, partial [Planctomycetota bacterium]|nr:hypothetical protein [Planctomycetota bacterium]
HSCNDYFNYEKTVRTLIKVDEEGRPDHLRELAMSLLEKGQRRDARLVLEQLKQTEDASTTSDEFEAGVLSLAGMHTEAMQAYYRSLARNPERIDTYLLLANTLTQLGGNQRAQGMFQSLAAAPVQDDLFTIAVDGVLNLQGPRRQPKPSPLLAWTRRMALERVAMRPHKLYLYQLVADLSDEQADAGMAKRALSAALPIAGEQRTPLLRELMERTRTARPRALGAINLAGRAPRKPSGEHLMLGRRLLGQGDVVPPDVYLDLGAAFLAGGEVVNASRTFSAASRLPEFDDLQRKIAGAFETAGYSKEALRTYERVLTVESQDVKLLAKVGELHERMGRDEIALGLFERGLSVLLALRPFNQTTEGPVGAPSPLMYPFVVGGSRSTDEGVLTYPRLLDGLLATLPNKDACARLLDRQDQEINTALSRIGSAAPGELRMGRHPQLALRTAFYRRLAVAFGDVARADSVDSRLLAAMPADEKLLDEAIGFRVNWGLLDSARGLLAKSPAAPESRSRHGLRLATVDPGEIAGLIPVARAAPLVLPLLASGDDTKLRTLMERVDLSNARTEDLDQIPTLINASLCLGDAELCLNLMRFWADTAFSQIRNPAQLNLAFTKLMTQSNEIRILSARQRQTLISRIVDRIADDPDRFSTLIRRVWTLMTPGDGVLDAKQVERLIRGGLSSSDRLAYGIPELFGFLPAENREAVLRSVFPLLAPSQKGYFIANYVRLNDIGGSKQLRTFILRCFEQGLRDADNPLVVTSAGTRLIRELRPKNIGIIFDILDIIEKHQPDKKIPFNTISRSMQSSGLATDTEEAWEAFVAIWNKYANRDDADAKALGRMLKPFASKRQKELKPLVAKLENEAKRKAVMRSLRLGKPPTIKVAATLEELRDKVEVLGLRGLTQLEGMLSAKGYWMEAVRVQERIVKASPNPASRAALAKMWSDLRHPLNALAADPSAASRNSTRAKALPRSIMGLARRGTSSTTMILGGIGARGTSSPKITETQVKKAIKKKDNDEARRLYRGFWRQDASSNIIRQTFATSSLMTKGLRSSATPVAPGRGGLSRNYNLRPAFLDWQPTEWKPKSPDRKKLPFIVAQTPFGVDELTRQLRSVDPQRLGQPNIAMIVQAVATQMVEEGGAAALGPVLARHEAGIASAADYAILFVVLETLETRPDGITEPLLDAVLANVGADAEQVRRLAGLFVRFGFPAKAAALYRWCACDAGRADPRTGIIRGRRDHADLLGEVLSRLSGEHRAKAVATILQGSRFPKHDRVGVDVFESTTIGMLVALDGPAAALAQSRGLVNNLFDLGTPPRRQTALRAAGLLARDGSHERALDLVQIAIVSHPVPTGTRPHERRYWDQGRAMDLGDYQWLFPKDRSDWKDAPGWYEAVAARMLKWRDDQKLSRHAPLHVLA